MKFIRFWVRGFGFLGIILGILTTVVLFWQWSMTLAGHNDNVNLAFNQIFFITTNSQFQSSRLLFLFLTLWLSVQSFVFGVGLVRYSFLSDADFCANKWALILFSLSLFTWWVAFVLLIMPNADVKSTRAADSTIVRYMGTVCYVAPLTIMMSLLSAQQWIAHQTGVAMNSKQLRAFFAMIGSLIAVGVLALVSTCPFYSKKVDQELYAEERNKIARRFLWAIVIFYRLVATVELVILVLVAVLRVLFAFVSLFQSRNVLLALFRLFFVISALFSAAFLIYLVGAVMNQLWRGKQAHGLVVIKEWQRYSEHKKKLALKQNAARR